MSIAFPLCLKSPGFVRAGALMSLATLLTSAAYAESSAPALAPPAGVEACQACHGREGISTAPTIPNLAGQKRDYLVAQLTAFRNKERKNDFMAAIAGQLSEDDVKRFAAYWSSLPAEPIEGHGQAAGPAIPSRMAFPINFPAGFSVYETASDDDGVMKRYANDIAIRAARAGQALPDGSVIVVVNYEAKKDASGSIVAGAAKSYSAMESRAGWGAAIPRLLQNGNWDYALFSADHARRDSLNQALCLACHKPMASDSYMFTLKTLRESATAGHG